MFATFFHTLLVSWQQKHFPEHDKKQSQATEGCNTINREVSCYKELSCSDKSRRYFINSATLHRKIYRNRCKGNLSGEFKRWGVQEHMWLRNWRCASMDCKSVAHRQQAASTIILWFKLDRVSCNLGSHPWRPWPIRAVPGSWTDSCLSFHPVRATRVSPMSVEFQVKGAVWKCYRKRPDV